MKDHFEAFCKEYNLDYDFERLGDTYANQETHKAFIIWKNTRPDEWVKEKGE